MRPVTFLICASVAGLAIIMAPTAGATAAVGIVVIVAMGILTLAS